MLHCRTPAYLRSNNSVSARRRVSTTVSPLSCRRLCHRLGCLSTMSTSWLEICPDYMAQKYEHIAVRLPLPTKQSLTDIAAAVLRPTNVSHPTHIVAGRPACWIVGSGPGSWLAALLAGWFAGWTRLAGALAGECGNDRHGQAPLPTNIRGVSYAPAVSVGLQGSWLDPSRGYSDLP